MFSVLLAGRYILEIWFGFVCCRSVVYSENIGQIIYFYNEEGMYRVSKKNRDLCSGVILGG